MENAKPGLQPYVPIMDAVAALASPMVFSHSKLPWRAAYWEGRALAVCTGRMGHDIFIGAVAGRKPGDPSSNGVFRLFSVKGGVVDHPLRGITMGVVDGTSVTPPGVSAGALDLVSDWLDFVKLATDVNVLDQAGLDAALADCPLAPANRLAEYEVTSNSKTRWVISHHDGALTLFSREETCAVPGNWDIRPDSGHTMEVFLTGRVGTCVKAPSEETKEELKLQKVLQNLAKGS